MFVFASPPTALSDIKNDLEFALNGERVTIKAQDVDPYMTLNEYLRDRTTFKGTKISCGEGGCGACVVTLSRWDAIHKRVIEGPVNSCLRPLAACDGCAITTVEGLGSSSTGFHPIQERLAGLHGTQCGFCTPGMVMAIYSNFKHFNAQGGKNLTVKQAEGFLDGNICRCTGYRPILDTVKSFAKDTDIKDNITKNTSIGPYDESKDPKFPEFLKSHKFTTLRFATADSGTVWYRPNSLKQLFKILNQAKEEKQSVKLVQGNTQVGIYKTDKYQVYVDVQAVYDLHAVSIFEEGVRVGGGCSITEFIAALSDVEHKDPSKVASFEHIIQHALRIASYNVRNVGSIAGNLMMTKTRGFLSDLATVLLGASVTVTIASSSKDEIKKREISIDEFLSTPTWKQDEVVYSITVPWTTKGDIYRTYKTAIRPQNAHAIVNAAFFFNIKGEGIKREINKAVLAFGGVMEVDAKGSHPLRAKKTEDFLKGKPLTNETLKAALSVLKSEVIPAELELKSYKIRLISSFFFKFFLTAIGEGLGRAQSATEGTYFRPISSGSQSFSYDEKDKTAVYKPIHKIEGKIQASGEARYITDMPLEPETIHAIIVGSTVASGKITEIDYKETLKLPGIVDVVTARDIPGENAYPIWGFFPTPPMQFLAADKVEYYGQPVAVVLAETRKQAEAAVQTVKVKYQKDDPVLTIEEAREKKTSYSVPTVSSLKAGDAEGELKKAKHKLTGTNFIGTQKHFYMETQSCYVVPDEDGQFNVFTNCQFHGDLPQNIAKVLKIPQSKIRVVLRRAGGAFGGKATPTFQFVLLTCLAASKAKRPVLLFLSRDQDMTIVGGREDGLQEYQVGFDDKGKISAVRHQADVGGGFGVDLSMWSNGVANENFYQVYNIPNQLLNATLWKTNRPARTVMRAPGEVLASYFVENIIAQVAFTLGVTPEEIRERNFFDEKEKAKDPHGTEMLGWSFPTLWKAIKTKVDWSKRLEAAQKYNKENRWKKRGVAITPVNYKVYVLPKDALVNINNDGSIVIHHTGCEMGQGLNTKVAQVAVTTLSEVVDTPLDASLVRFADGNSSVIPNGRGTGGSTGSESTVQAVRLACDILVGRLKRFQEAQRKEAEEKAKKSGKSSEGKEARKYTWESLILEADRKDVDLSAKARFADHEHTSDILAYHNFGVCFSEIELDVLTGEVNIVESNLLYDCGKSLNPAIDIGQVEGAFVMGIGHVLREQERVDKDGKLLTTNTWSYKPPGARDVPQRFIVGLLQNGFDRGILSSKASGEPPLVLALSIALAVRFAVHSAREDAGLKEWVRLDIPMTPDAIAAACGVQDKDLV